MVDETVSGPSAVGPDGEEGSSAAPSRSCGKEEGLAASLHLERCLPSGLDFLLADLLCFFCLNAFSCHAFHRYWRQGRALPGVRAVCTWDKRQHSWRHRKAHMPLHRASGEATRRLALNCPSSPCPSGPLHIPSRKTKAGRATRPCMRNRCLRLTGDPNACRLCTMLAGTHRLLR